VVEVVMVAAARFHYTVDMITKPSCSWKPQGDGAKIEDPRDHRGHQGQQYPAVAKVGLFGLLALGQLHGCKMAKLATSCFGLPVAAAF